jgi:hypothetical protein
MPMPKPIKAVLAPCRGEFGDRCAHFPRPFARLQGAAPAIAITKPMGEFEFV